MTTQVAVIATGGKQILVKPGDVVRVEKLAGEKDGRITFSDVLLIANGADATTVGTPLVKGATVEATITKQGRADKVVGVKFRPKKRYKKTFSHRQHFTEVRIEKITG